MIRLKLFSIAAVAAAVGCSSQPAAEYSVVWKSENGDRITKSIVVPKGSSKDEIKTVTTLACGRSRTFCNLIFWDNPGNAARSMPMSQAELDTRIAQYVRNTSTGLDRLTFDQSP